MYYKNAEIERSLFHGINIVHFNKYFEKYILSFLDSRKSLINPIILFSTVCRTFLYLAEALRRIFLTFIVIKKNDIDIVHANNSLSINIFSIIAAKLAGVPCVCHIRGCDVVGRLHKLIIPLPSCYIAMSELLRHDFMDSKYVTTYGSAVDVFTIYDGVTENELSYDYSLKSSLRQTYSIENNIMLVGMVGMLTEWKGFHIFLEAAAKIVAVRNDIVFFIVGDTIHKNDNASYKDYLYELVDQYDIAKYVIFTGQILDTQNVYGSLDIVVHASINPEPFGRVIIEAMAASRPVVASNAGGPTEIIQNGITGMLFEPSNTSDLARNILMLLDDSELRQKIGLNARKLVEEKFVMSNAVDQVENVYHQLLR